MTYEVTGKEFHSIKDLAEYFGVHEKTITARLRRGMSAEEACLQTDLRCSYAEDNKSISQICKEQEKDDALVRNRLRYGYSLQEALNKPKKISRQGKPIVVNGVLYNSLSMACRKLKLVEKENTIRSRLRAGKTPNEAFSFDE